MLVGPSGPRPRPRRPSSCASRRDARGEPRRTARGSGRKIAAFFAPAGADRHRGDGDASGICTVAGRASRPFRDRRPGARRLQAAWCSRQQLPRGARRPRPPAMMTLKPFASSRPGELGHALSACGAPRGRAPRAARRSPRGPRPPSSSRRGPTHSHQDGHLARHRASSLLPGAILQSRAASFAQAPPANAADNRDEGGGRRPPDSIRKIGHGMRIAAVLAGVMSWPSSRAAGRRRREDSATAGLRRRSPTPGDDREGRPRRHGAPACGTPTATSARRPPPCVRPGRPGPTSPTTESGSPSLQALSRPPTSSSSLPRPQPHPEGVQRHAGAVHRCSTDGSIAFCSDRGGAWDIFVMDVTVNGAVRPDHERRATTSPPTWSADGRLDRHSQLARSIEDWEIWIANLENAPSSPPRRPLPRWSPKSDKIAFSDPPPRRLVVRDLRGRGEREQRHGAGRLLSGGDRPRLEPRRRVDRLRLRPQSPTARAEGRTMSGDDIWIVHADGTSLMQVTVDEASSGTLAGAPTGGSTSHGGPREKQNIWSISPGSRRRARDAQVTDGSLKAQ